MAIKNTSCPSSLNEKKDDKWTELNNYRIKNVERKPVHAEDEPDGDEKVNGSPHPGDVVLDPLDHVRSGPARVRGKLVHLLVKSDLQLTVNL